MQNKEMKNKYVLISVPAELLLAAGLFDGEAIEIYTDNGKLVIQNAKLPEDFQCGGDCESCPMSVIDCTGNCGDCPCNKECDDAEVDG